MSVVAAFAMPHPPIIIPEVGRGEEAKIRKTADAFYECAEEIARLKPETIIVASPHSVMYADYFHISPGNGAKGSLSRFGAGGVRFEVAYDAALAEEIERLAAERNIPAGTDGERGADLDHGTLVPLYFINKKYDGYKLLRVGLSGLPLETHFNLGRVIAESAKLLDRRAVFVASGDLSHKLKEDGPYGYAKEAPVFDAAVTKAFSEGDLARLTDIPPDLADKAAECGLRSFVIMAGAIDGEGFKSKLLSYEGTFGVGYAVA
ncbi:MAG: AmmeMemoRadiSam system protein B, partial [Oscillospiraceae bacterium]|nr:AmmeMemoRadiSam system protein B [Oscillospiraceae bacterium]